MLLVCYEMGTAAGALLRRGPAGGDQARSLLAGRLREQVRDVTAAVQIRLTPDQSADAGRSRSIGNCCTARRSASRCASRYTSFGDDGQIVTKLSPYRLLFSRHSWYVIGRSSLHREVRTFNVGRISDLRAAGRRASKSRAAFSIERYLGNAWHLIPEPGPDVMSWSASKNWWPATWPKCSGTRPSGSSSCPTAGSIFGSPFRD